MNFFHDRDTQKQMILVAVFIFKFKNFKLEFYQKKFFLKKLSLFRSKLKILVIYQHYTFESFKVFFKENYSFFYKHQFF